MAEREDVVLTREHIVAKAAELKRTKIKIEEWKGFVYVRELTGSERDKVEGDLLQGRNRNDFTGVRAHVACIALVDQEGRRLFEETDKDVLSTLSGKALDKIFAEVSKISGMNEEAEQSLADRLGKAQTE